jgi:uncharacterized protein YacL
MNRLFSKKTTNAPRARSLILDTNGLIDGRIIEVAKAGFVPENIIIPQFVIAELQFLADKGDSHKRERARFGLDVIRELQDLPATEVTIAREKFSNIKEVDDKLVALAKQYRAPLYTIDYNLNKVAQIEGVTVLNVNELAHALRPHHLPGEKATVKLVQPGQDSHQAVGYLEDGTMVVVEQARKLIGQKVEVAFTRMLQTQAGKMSFATLDKTGKGKSHDNQKPVRAFSQAQAAPKVSEHKPQPQHDKQQKTGGGQPKNHRRPHGKKPNPEDTLISLANQS